MEPPTSPAAPTRRLRARHLGGPAVAVGLVIILVHALSGPGAVQDWTYLVVGAGASLAAWVGALRGDRHLAAILVALGVSLTALGDTMNQILVWARPVAPDLSVADLTWVASYVVLVAALLVTLRGSASRRLDIDGWLDIGAVTVLAVLIQWEVSVRSLAGDASLAPVVRFVWILYPALDGVLLVLVARALMAGHLRSRPALLLAIGTSCWLVADVAVTVAVPDGHSSPRIDVGWLVGSIALALAAWQPRSVAPAHRVHAGSASGPVGYHRVAVGLLPLAVPGGIELIGYLRGGAPNPVPLFACLLVLLAIAYLRTIRLMRSNHRSQEELAHQALHDGLTGLANRALLTDRVDQALGRSTRTGLRPAVLFLDLDRFKTVNDTLGHPAGDELLQVLSRRLVAAVRPGDTVARFGGDEFAILVEPTEWPLHDAELTAARILRVVTEPVALGDQVVSLSASLGVAVGEPGATASSLLRDADVAMYRAKATGRGRWVAYDSSMRTAVVEQLQLATDLTRALGEGQLALAYQPVVELEEQRLVGFEALIRWNHPTAGQVAPDQFISLAEESGLILPIGTWVLQEACRTAAHWHRTYPDQAHLSMSVNVSAHQVASGDLVAQLTDALEDSGLDPATLIVELTESALVEDPQAAAEQLHRIRDLGVRIAIDDFGTGYSSLAYLRMFPLDILKIDRSFVETIADRHQVPAIVRGLLELAHTLELETLAEGVEHEAQRDGLRDASCDLAQGFLFGRPLDLADAEALLLRAGAGAPPMAARQPTSPTGNGRA